MRVTRAVLPILAFADASGVPAAELLRTAGLDPATFAGPDIDLLNSQELRLWSEAARLTGDAEFGLHLAEWLVPRTDDVFDVLSFALRSCATLGDHYRRASRYFGLVHAGTYLRLEEEATVARLVHGHTHEPSPPPRHPVEGLLALAFVQGQKCIGGDFAPREVRFVHARPARVSEHERIFRAPVRFGCDRNELVIDRALLERPQRDAEPRLLAVLHRQLDGLMAEQPRGDGFVDAVQRWMMDELPDREPSIAAIAAKQRMSARTLQRRLQDSGTSFAAVLSDLRHALALRYLHDQRIAIGEVGFLLGFRDVTAFHRAFKRWSGMTPAMHRRSAEAQGARS
jgi:AraC-like DNA-binding protein